MSRSVGITPVWTPLDDALMTEGKNGKPALATVIAAPIVRQNAVAYRGRAIHTWWGGGFTTNASNVLRQVWNQHFAEARYLRSQVLYVPNNSTYLTTQGIEGSLGGAAATLYPTAYDMSAFTAQTEPQYVREAQVFGDVSSTPAGRSQIALGSASANGPNVVAGHIYEMAQTACDPVSTGAYSPAGHVGAGLPILATNTASPMYTFERAADRFIHIWNRKRPQIGWSMARPGTNYVDFTVSPQAYRYIFDQRYGDGGTAPALTGPGITFPLRYAANGIATTVGVAIYVYAAMSGSTDTGSIAFAHKALGGASMTTFGTASSGAPTISGTTFAWYPALTGTPAIFNMRADLAYERILLAAKSSGATDTVRIAAFTMFPMPSQTIP